MQRKTIFKNLLRALIRKMLILVKIDCISFYARTVLYSVRYAFWKFCYIQKTTCATFFDFCTKFSSFRFAWLNVYFLAARQEPQVRGVGSLGDWKQLGFDQHSLIANPRFVDVEQGDYRLRPESPAFSLGFQPIPVDQIGPRRRVVPHDKAGATR